MSKILVLCLIPLLLATACKLESQNLADTFEDGKIPPSLARLANQTHEFARLQEQATKAAARDRGNPGILPVAVMDNGFDFSHPEIVNKLRFTLDKQGQIVGAGLDVMGRDSWPSSNLVNPSFYAFGAKQIKAGKIVGPPENPLELMAKYNREFVDGLLAKVQADPELKDSLFGKKLTRDSFSIFGVQGLFKNWEKFDTERYEEAKEKGHLIGAEFPAKPPKGYPSATAYEMQSGPWRMQRKEGFPSFADYGQMTSIEKSDRFYKLLKGHFEEFQKKSGYGEALDRYVGFMRSRQTEFVSKEKAAEEALEKLNQALYFKTYGTRGWDPIHSVNEAFQASIRKQRSDALEKAKTAEERAAALKPIAAAEIQREFDNALESHRAYVEFLSKMPDKTAEEAQAVRQLEKDLPKVHGLLRSYLADRNWNLSSTLDLDDKTPQASEYRKYLIRTAHPMLDGGSGSATHGSHVSGIIARQHPDLRIVPVRVTTQGTEVAPKGVAKMKADFTKRFEGWLADPVVFRAVADKFKGAYPQFAQAAEDPTKRAAAAGEIMKLLKETIDVSFEQKTMEYVFFDEIERAVEYIGKEKIKLTNVSLGTSFDKAVGGGQIQDPVAQVQEFFEFLRYEYFKHSIATKIEKDAPKTLFVVATGNDGKWVDGHSRSALPVDLSSPFLEKHQRPERGEIAPNNRLRNILAVGSIGPENTLSSFTNIPISKNTTFVLAHGEEILAPIKTTDPEGMARHLQREIPSLQNLEPISPTDERLLEFFRKHMGAATKEEQMNSAIRFMLSTHALDSVKEGAAHHLAIKFPVSLGRLSGTSMATPAANGILGRMVQEKAKRLGVPVSQVYDHPEFTPEKLLDDVIAKGEPLFGDSGARGIAFKALLGDLVWDEDPDAVKLQAYLKGLDGKPVPFPCAPGFVELGRGAPKRP